MPDPRINTQIKNICSIGSLKYEIGSTGDHAAEHHVNSMGSAHRIADCALPHHTEYYVLHCNKGYD
ncbi:hypothetical protein FF100_05485 [Methylobacterium terricola]|uniref:Uncharacterized protein n=1 Tax=Methylobacterium terricola TaxID=2583531 RepID=A0A5C4LNP4_9HYPH|nr:hypothetical protein [Methylobacterium terricola]TNC15019.1 hypothetical protein FF100_05485 [Methylobacterium terricola]